jgi:hypothetical protein
MSLQKDLATIEEYNAAMELPFAGLVGLGAYVANRPADVSVAIRELTACVELCRMGKLALSGDLAAARRNAYLFSAWRRLGTKPEDRVPLKGQLEQISQVLELILKLLRGEKVAQVPTRTQLNQTERDLRSLSERIRATIPREASLSSLISGGQAPVTNRRL